MPYAQLSSHLFTRDARVYTGVVNVFQSCHIFSGKYRRHSYSVSRNITFITASLCWTDIVSFIMCIVPHVVYIVTVDKNDEYISVGKRVSVLSCLRQSLCFTQQQYALRM